MKGPRKKPSRKPLLVGRVALKSPREGIGTFGRIRGSKSVDGGTVVLGRTYSNGYCLHLYDIDIFYNIMNFKYSLCF